VVNNWKQGNYSTNDFDFCTEFTATTPTPTVTPSTNTSPSPSPSQTPETGNFMSDKECNKFLDCWNPNYPICWGGYCCKANEELRNYILSKFEDPPCDEKQCETCNSGTLGLASVGYNDYEVRYCIECSQDRHCIEGYKCEDKTCVEDTQP